MSRNRLADWSARGFLFLVLATLYILTWEKWGNLVIDTGREMYIPAILSQGKRLYFDAWYVYGPIIPYWHALLFRIFGIHLEVLYITGFCVVTAISALLYSLSRQFLPIPLSVAVVFAFLLQAFQPQLFNYILPYSYPAVYGSLFAVLLLWILVRNSLDPKPWHMSAAGAVAMLMALDKIEFAVVAYAGILWAIAIRTWKIRSLSSLVKDLAALAPGIIVWISVYLRLSSQSSRDFLFGENLSILPDSWFAAHFGKAWAETHGLTLAPLELARSIATALKGFIALSAVLFLAVRYRLAGWIFALGGSLAAILSLLHRLPEPLSSARWLALALAIGDRISWLVFFNRGMIWISILLLVITFWKWLQSGYSAETSALLLLPVFAVGCGVRVLTEVEPHGYSIFFDVLPYLTWLVALYYFSQFFWKQQSDRSWLVTGALLCLGVFCLVAPEYVQTQSRSLVCSPRGNIYASTDIGDSYPQLLDLLNDASARSESFVMMPEDTAVYYLTGAAAPSRWYVLIPPVFPPAKTNEYLAELDQKHVEYVVLTNRATPEYGFSIFGVDYGQEIREWIDANFMLVKQIGDFRPDPHPQKWAAQIYKRRTGTKQ